MNEINEKNKEPGEKKATATKPNPKSSYQKLKVS